MKKKLTAFLLATLMLMGTVACSGNQEGNSSGGQASSGGSSQNQETAWKPVDSSQYEPDAAAGETDDRAFMKFENTVDVHIGRGVSATDTSLEENGATVEDNYFTQYLKDTYNLPISVIVVDFFHWTAQGDWKFDPVYWPDPAAMVRELKEMGIELMVSIWPTAEKASENYTELAESGYLIHSEAGRRGAYLGDVNIVDFTNPEAREYVWSKIKENYYDKGIHAFWLDEAEPEINPYDFRFFRFYRGSDIEIGNIYPKQYARMAYEGMEKAGQENIMNLVRCAWAGSQRYGALVWSGDIDSNFRSLREQFAAGLNMGLAGIPWWTTDIGGFSGGNIYDEKFRECLIRWFEYATFCPVMRIHGVRAPMVKKESPYAVEGSMSRTLFSGADNEVWSYGDEAYEIFKKYLLLREKIRPYLKNLMKEAHEKGSPVIRPLFYQYPEDAEAWDVCDQFMLGEDVLVAPVLYEGMRERSVYLTSGSWKNIHTGEILEGPLHVNVLAPLDAIPVFVRTNCAFDVSLP